MTLNLSLLSLAKLSCGRPLLASLSRVVLLRLNARSTRTYTNPRYTYTKNKVSVSVAPKVLCFCQLEVV